MVATIFAEVTVTPRRNLCARCGRELVDHARCAASLFATTSRPDVFVDAVDYDGPQLTPLPERS
jgi:hypothetical protein